mgnify:CR=1 FL=1
MPLLGRHAIAASPASAADNPRPVRIARATGSTLDIRETPMADDTTRPRVPDPAHLPEGSVARAAELAADPARAGPAAGRDQPRPRRRADRRRRSYEVTRDGDRHDQGQRQDAVPGRGQAGRHLRDPQHPRRAAAADHRHRLPAASSIRTCARSSPTSARAPASRRWCCRRSTSRRCSRRSRRSRPSAGAGPTARGVAGIVNWRDDRALGDASRR